MNKAEEFLLACLIQMMYAEGAYNNIDLSGKCPEKFCIVGPNQGHPVFKRFKSNLSILKHFIKKIDSGYSRFRIILQDVSRCNARADAKVNNFKFFLSFKT